MAAGIKKIYALNQNAFKEESAKDCTENWQCEDGGSNSYLVSVCLQTWFQQILSIVSEILDTNSRQMTFCKIPANTIRAIPKG